MGTVKSPGPRGPTCADGSPNFCYYDSCGQCEDGCWWTTCDDTVATVLEVLDEVLDRVCVDLDRVWAAGCSNGGMMVYEVLADARAAGRFAGGLPMVASPHAGFQTLPTTPAHLIGLWGATDTTIPTVSNTEWPDVSVDTMYDGGWYDAAERTSSSAGPGFAPAL